MVAPVPLQARFWSKVNTAGRSIIPDSPCWEWTGAVGAWGYGKFSTRHPFWRPDPTATEKAHRVAWRLLGYPLTADELLLHRCDNPLCVRPDHLYVGTQLQNRADAVQRGRTAKGGGTHRGSRKLDEAAVRSMRTRRASGETVEALARAFSVSKATAYAVVTGRRWGWLT